MKRFLKYILGIVLMTFAFFSIFTLSIILCPKGTFHQSFDSVLYDKYQILLNTNEPKIIIVAGSSCAFGIDQYLIEEETGYKVANLGLHAGFGHKVISEFSKANINPGDIVLLAYEWNWNDEFNRSDPRILMPAIDNHIEMYVRVPLEYWSDCLSYLVTFAAKKNTFEGWGGIYSREAFDQNGQMIEGRYDVCQWDGTDGVDISEAVIPEDVAKYLIDYKNYVESRGATVRFVVPPILDEALFCDFSDFDRFISEEETTIGIEYISDQRNYVFPAYMMFDSTYHCNSFGERARSLQLVQDLRDAGLVR